MYMIGNVEYMMMKYSDKKDTVTKTEQSEVKAEVKDEATPTAGTGMYCISGNHCHYHVCILSRSTGQTSD